MKKLNFTKTVLLVTLATITFVGCHPTPPKTFIRTDESAGAAWKSIEVRRELTYEQSWQLLIDTLSSRWDIETMEKEAGYIRTVWVWTTGKDSGTGQPYSYGKRITAKFSEDRKMLRVKTECCYSVAGYPTEYGIDSAFDDDAFTQIAGKMGRVAR